MALRAHETLSVTTGQTPATTEGQLIAYGGAYVLCSTTAAVRFTVDGLTTPVITGAAEIGTLLSTTNEGGLTHIILTREEFLNSKWVSVTGTARVQFEFLTPDRRRIS